MDFSDFGRKVTRDAGILQLMNDLGNALDGTPLKAMFGGGNPANIPEVTDVFKGSLQKLLESPDTRASMLGNYDTPKGNVAFIMEITKFLNKEYELGITEENVAITPGSQTGFFLLFNLLAGKSGDSTRKILFPLVPEYIGYADQGLEHDMFQSLLPRIEKIGKHEFKYHVDFDNLRISEEVAALCVSRPTNPSGNVISDKELHHLADLCKQDDKLLIIDNAYGKPFPGVIRDNTSLFWDSNIVLSMSLSKVGLPTSRVGIFIANKEITQALVSANAIVSLASPSIGQYIAAPLIASRKISQLCSDVIQPYYTSRRLKMDTLITRYFPDDLPWRMHRYEGSYFYWLWIEGAAKTSNEVYEYLKKRSVLVVPGDYFFPGQENRPNSHKQECLRINFARPDHELEAGVPIVADAIRWAYTS